MKTKRSKPRRTSVHRDRKYLDWLWDRRCAVCKSHGNVVPAHGPSAGKGVKGPDNGAIPLCIHCHNEQHSIGWPDFEARHNLNREREADANYTLFQIETSDDIDLKVKYFDALIQRREGYVN